MAASLTTTRRPEWRPPTVFWLGAFIALAALSAGTFLLTQVNSPTANARVIAVNRQVLFPAGLSVRWQGSFGRSSATLLTFSSRDTPTSGILTCQGVDEKLIVEVRNNGALTLKGTSYHRRSGSGPYYLDTLVGTLSSDGTILRGTYSDTAGNRGEWRFSREAVLSSSIAQTQSGQAPASNNFANIPATSTDESRVYSHSNGTFSRVANGQWVEKSGSDVYHFAEYARDNDWIYLRDSGRDMNVRLPTQQQGWCAWQRGPINPTGSWNNLYFVTR